MYILKGTGLRTIKQITTLTSPSTGASICDRLCNVNANHEIACVFAVSWRCHDVALRVTCFVPRSEGPRPHKHCQKQDVDLLLLSACRLYCCPGPDRLLYNVTFDYIIWITKAKITQFAFVILSRAKLSCENVMYTPTITPLFINVIEGVIFILQSTAFAISVDREPVRPCASGVYWSCVYVLLDCSCTTLCTEAPQASARISYPAWCIRMICFCAAACWCKHICKKK